MLTPSILLLKEGTDDSQGKPQIISNINACQALVDIVKTTLGPRGMDKLIHSGSSVTITNDGATVINLLEVVHPATKMLVDIARAQDNEMGDGTTSVVVLAGEFLKEAKAFVEEGVHPQIIIKGYREAVNEALKKIKDVSVKIDEKNRRDILIKCAQTALSSKLVASYREFFAEMVVSAVEKLEGDMDKSLIGLKKVTGGSVTDSFLVDGVAFKKTFSYAGFEQQPKKFTNPKILLLNLELELKAEKENAEVRIEKPEDYQSIVDAEWKIIYDKLESIVKSGAVVILSKLPIGDLATQYFADRGIFCAGRVPEDDLKRVAKATGATIQVTVQDLTPSVLGTCGEFEERQIGGERYNLFKKCVKAKSATIVLRGGAEQFIEEAERSLNDAIMIVRRAVKTRAIVAGGGAIEMELSKSLRDYARNIQGKRQAIVSAYARALEIIPMTLSSNAGLDSTDLITKLRKAHVESETNKWVGVNFNAPTGIADNYADFVWEPETLKLSILNAATEVI
jgi:T-complex protein 1 subunit eta